MPTATLNEASLMIDLVNLFQARFKDGGKLGANDVAVQLNASLIGVQKVIRFLKREKALVELASHDQHSEPKYVLGRQIDQDDLIKMIKEYLRISELVQNFDSSESALNRAIFAEIFKEFRSK